MFNSIIAVKWPENKTNAKENRTDTGQEGDAFLMMYMVWAPESCCTWSHAISGHPSDNKLPFFHKQFEFGFHHLQLKETWWMCRLLFCLFFFVSFLSFYWLLIYFPAEVCVWKIYKRTLKKKIILPPRGDILVNFILDFFFFLIIRLYCRHNSVSTFFLLTF